MDDIDIVQGCVLVSEEGTGGVQCWRDQVLDGATSVVVVVVCVLRGIGEGAAAVVDVGGTGTDGQHDGGHVVGRGGMAGLAGELSLQIRVRV